MAANAAVRDSGLAPYLSAHTRQSTEINERVLLTILGYEECARRHMSTSNGQKLRMLIEYLARHSVHPGAFASFDPDLDAAVIDAMSRDEAFFHLRRAIHERLIEGDINGGSFSVTYEGWTFVQPIAGGVPGRCFVAMNFGSELNDIYREAIEPAIRTDCGYFPVRIDQIVSDPKQHTQVTDAIIAQVRLAHFVVADFTDQKHGVYFETGFAMALGRPLIWMCRDDDKANLHFDTRQYPHILWADKIDLRAQLTNRILSMLGRYAP